MSVQAQALEAEGELEAALRAYLEGGDPVAAARIAARLEDFERAAMLLLRGLKVGPGRRLTPEQRQRAFCAAMFLGQAGRVREAIELMVNLGERQRAAELMRNSAPKGGEQLHGALDEAEVTRLASQTRGRALERRGDLGSALKAYLEGGAQAEAARVAEAMGRAGQAAEIYERAGLYFAAARCHRIHGEDAAAWACLCRVSGDDPRYEDAIEAAVELARARSTLDFRFEQFVEPFIQAPVEQDRVERLVSLAKVYEEHGVVESAQEICQALYRAGFKNAARTLKSARAVSGVSGALPELPGLPELPEIFLSELPDETPAHELDALPSLPQPPRLGPSTKRLSVVSGAIPVLEAWDTGTTIADRYLLGERLGRGGMATVFLAEDLQLGEKVAVKVFERNTDLEMLERFKREVRLTRRVHDSNVIRVYDVGSVQGVWFITMEYLQGHVLSHMIRRKPGLKKLLWLLIQAAKGLAAAHQHAIVHRDVKPSNLFVTAKGVLKVMDFGIAKALGENDHTATGRIVGTPKYMSPEQISGFSKVSPQADVYSLGAVAYEMFTGAVPFSHPDTLPILMMQLTAKPEAPRLKNEQIPKALEALILSMLIKEPQRRIQGAQRVAERAREIFKGLP